MKHQVSLEYIFLLSFIITLSTPLIFYFYSTYKVSNKYVSSDTCLVKDFSLYKNGSFYLLIENCYDVPIKIREISLNFQGKYYNASSFSNPLNEEIASKEKQVFHFNLSYSTSYSMLLLIYWDDLYSNNSFVSKTIIRAT